VRKGQSQEQEDQTGAGKLEQLRADIRVGIESSSAGDLDIAAIKRSGRALIDAMQASPCRDVDIAPEHSAMPVHTSAFDQTLADPRYVVNSLTSSLPSFSPSSMRQLNLSAELK
jgi:hypothetical protein